MVPKPSIETRPAAGSKARRFTLLIVAAALCVLGYFAFRTLRGLMMLGYVDSAIGRVHVLYAAEAQFSKENPELGYTCTLSQLPRSEQTTRLLARSEIDNGYAFEITACQAAGPKKPNTTYQVGARPLHAGQPDFCIDQAGILMFDEKGSTEKCFAERRVFP